VFFKKKRLKAQDIIGWEEPLPGGVQIGRKWDPRVPGSGGLTARSVT
jgi:hypothetical protein